MTTATSTPNADNTRHPYSDAQDRFIALLRDLSSEQADQFLSTCPAWTTRDVAAHVSGLVAEVLANVPPPRGSDEATTRQVSNRSHMTLAEICDEWESNADAFSARMAEEPDMALGLSGDLAVHIHDVCEGLGLGFEPNDDFTQLGARRYAGLLQERVAAELNIALTIEFPGIETHEATAAGATTHMTLTASPYEFLRSVTGRRTRGQVHELTWSEDPTTLIDQAWLQYGSFDDR